MEAVKFLVRHGFPISPSPPTPLPSGERAGVRGLQPSSKCPSQYRLIYFLCPLLRDCYRLLNGLCLREPTLDFGDNAALFGQEAGGSQCAINQLFASCAFIHFGGLPPELRRLYSRFVARLFKQQRLAQ